MATAAAKRYARAIFELAQESKAIPRWQKRLQTVAAALADESTSRLLGDPSVPLTSRLEALEGAGKVWDQETRNLVKLLVESRRAAVADEIAAEYERLLDELEGRVRATATTAVALPAKEGDRLAAQLSQQLGKDVRLDLKVDPAIIGGLVLQFGDRVVDASVASRLQQLRRQLASA